MKCSWACLSIVVQLDAYVMLPRKIKTTRGGKKAQLIVYLTLAVFHEPKDLLENTIKLFV